GPKAAVIAGRASVQNKEFLHKIQYIASNVFWGCPGCLSSSMIPASTRIRCMTVPIERRASLRHTPVDKETNVQVMDQAGRRITTARLVNISRDGALILTDQHPGLNRRLWVRLKDSPELGWI